MPPLSALQRQPLEVLAQIDYQLSRGKTCAEVAASLAELGVATSSAAVGRYRKNIWLPKVERQKDMLALLEIVDPANPAKSLGRVNIALAQTLLKDNLELLALDDNVSPDEAIPLVLKAMMAQDKASKAVLADVTAALKDFQLDEIRKAKDGDLLTMKEGRLMRVEFVAAPAASGAASLAVKTPGKASGKTSGKRAAKPAPEKTAPASPEAMATPAVPAARVSARASKAAPTKGETA